MEKGTRSVFRRALWVAGAIVLLVAALWISTPFVPGEVAFGTEDLEARAKFKSIVEAHGFSYHHDKNVHGETMVVIDRITPREYQRIDCEFFAWDSERNRRAGVIVYDRKDCPL